MSAFIVDKVHIDAIISAAVSPQVDHSGASVSYYWPDDSAEIAYDTEHPEPYWAEIAVRRHEVSIANATEAGRMLWEENLASVAFRYPDDASGERPGPCDLSDDEIHGYTFQRLPGRPDPVVVLAALACYEYQSCEHPGWKVSEARAFCEALKDALIRRLPGYSEAPWEITDRSLFVR